MNTDKLHLSGLYYATVSLVSLNWCVKNTCTGEEIIEEFSSHHLPAVERAWILNENMKGKREPIEAKLSVVYALIQAFFERYPNGGPRLNDFFNNIRQEQGGFLIKLERYTVKRAADKFVAEGTLKLETDSEGAKRYTLVRRGPQHQWQ